MLKGSRKYIALFLFSFLFLSKPVLANVGCENSTNFNGGLGSSFVNLVSSVCWDCIFPIKIAGITIYQGSHGLVDPPDMSDTPICTCPAPPPVFIRIGLTISMWEPARLVETVKDAYCFPNIGLDLSNPNPGTLGGTSEGSRSEDVIAHSFAQAHYLVFPLWSMLEIALDSACIETSGFDVAYMTEIDPFWNDDMLAFFLNPEALLFGNPVAAFSCMADSVATLTGIPASPLFWCMGSWGNAYPLTGSINTSSITTANAGIAARMIYKMARSMLICDVGVNYCSCFPTPIWIKQNYRLQLAMPVRDVYYQSIGRTELLWGSLKDPFVGSGNFVWILFRKRVCCFL